MNHHKPHIFCWQKTHQTPLRHPPPSRNTGEVPNLFAPDERVQVCEMVRAAARAEGKAPEARVKRGFWKDECMDQRPKGLELTIIFFWEMWEIWDMFVIFEVDRLIIFEFEGWEDQIWMDLKLWLPHQVKDMT